MSAVVIVVWFPPAAEAAAGPGGARALRDMTGFHVRRIAEVLEADAAGRLAATAYITHRARAAEDLSKISLAQTVAETYGMDRAAARRRGGGRGEEDEDAAGREAAPFPAYGAYLEVWRRRRRRRRRRHIDMISGRGPRAQEAAPPLSDP